MLCAIISDIHSNLEALNTALDSLSDVDAIYCVGDVVGYGPNPNECCEVVREKSAATVMGNHDAAVIGKMALDWFNSVAREAAEWTREQLAAENRIFLEGLPYTAQAEGLTMVHGSLPMPERFLYINSPWEARPTFDSMGDSALCFIGHTHIAEYFVRKGRRERPPWRSVGADQISMTEGGLIELMPGFQYIINPGSIGQPRDGNPQASYAVYDSDARTVEIRRLEYPIQAVQEKMRAANLPEMLIARLGYGG